MVNRDCSTCAHHIQAGGIDKTPASCWSCLASEGLPGWHPMDGIGLGTRKDLEEGSAALRKKVQEHLVAINSHSWGVAHLNPQEMALRPAEPKPQSRKESLVEATLNTLSGFILSYLVWMLIAAPLFNIPVNHTETFWITCLFTVVSVVRSYVWRRLFVNRFWRKADV